MRLIDSDRLLSDRMKSKYYHLPNGDTAIPIIDIEHAPTVNQWIPCSERLPENGHYYLWCSDMGHVKSDYYWNGFEDGMKYGYNIVAWMPLPEPYKMEEKHD